MEIGAIGEILVHSTRFRELFEEYCRQEEINGATLVEMMGPGRGGVGMEVRIEIEIEGDGAGLIFINANKKMPLRQPTDNYFPMLGIIDHRGNISISVGDRVMLTPEKDTGAIKKFQEGLRNFLVKKFFDHELDG